MYICVCLFMTDKDSPLFVSFRVFIAGKKILSSLAVLTVKISLQRTAKDNIMFHISHQSQEIFSKKIKVYSRGFPKWKYSNRSLERTSYNNVDNFD